MLVSGMCNIGQRAPVCGAELLTRGVPRGDSRRSSGITSGVRRQGRGKNADERQCEQHGSCLLRVGRRSVRAGRGRGKGGVRSCEGRGGVHRAHPTHSSRLRASLLPLLRSVEGSPRLILDLSHPLRYTLRATPYRKSTVLHVSSHATPVQPSPPIEMSHPLPPISENGCLKLIYYFLCPSRVLLRLLANTSIVRFSLPWQRTAPGRGTLCSQKWTRS